MEKIYVVLSATPTKIGLIIRTLTRSTFNHASISLTKDLSEMYSFARYRATNPFVGGFIKEFPQRLSLGKDSDVYIKVYEIPVNDMEYKKVQAFIYKIRDDEEKNIYNSLAVLGRPFGKEFNTYKAYICSDFVIKALLLADLQFNSTMLTPGEMEKLLANYLCYTGYLDDYHPASGADIMVEEFFKKSSLRHETVETMTHFYSLIKRCLKKYEA